MLEHLTNGAHFVSYSTATLSGLRFSLTVKVPFCAQQPAVEFCSSPVRSVVSVGAVKEANTKTI